MMFIEAKFEIGQIVYLKTDEDQKPRMVTAMTLSPTGVRYCLTLGVNETWHFDIEISEVKNYAVV